MPPSTTSQRWVPARWDYAERGAQGLDSAEPNGVSTQEKTPGTQHICFTLKNGGIATIRASGTEPKLKYYIETMAGTEEESKVGGRLPSPLTSVQAIAQGIKAALFTHVLRPEHYGLTVPAN